MKAGLVPSSPAPQRSFRRLVIEKFGRRTCRHAYLLVPFRGRLFLRCSECGAETQGFTVYQPLRGGR